METDIAGYLKSEINIVAGLDSDNTAIVGRYSPLGAPGLHAPPASAVSTTTGVALLPDGWVLATGVDLIGLKPRSWLARVDPFTGEIVMLHHGDLGDAATGLAVDLGTASWTKVVTGEKGARAAGLTVTPEGHIVIIGTSIHEDGTSMILQGLHP